jgi:hypothetical protein
MDMITDVHDFRIEHQLVPCVNFRANLLTLWKKLAQQASEAAASAEGLAKDREKHPVQENAPGSTKPPCWQGSEAERLLKIDMDTGKNNWMSPEELHELSMEHAPFALDTFGKHVRQLEKTGKEDPTCSEQGMSADWLLHFGSNACGTCQSG